MCNEERKSKKKQIALAQRWADTYSVVCVVYQVSYGSHEASFQFCEKQNFKGTQKTIEIVPKKTFDS